MLQYFLLFYFFGIRKNTPFQQHSRLSTVNVTQVERRRRSISFFFVIVKSRGRTFILNSFPFYPVFFFCFLNVFIIFLIINVLGQRAVSRTHFIYFRVRHYRSLWLVRLFFFHSVR